MTNHTNSPSGNGNPEKWSMQLPPRDLQAEAACLGCMMLETSVVGDIRGLVDPLDFYLVTHQTVCRAIFDLHDSHNDPDAVSVLGLLENRNEIGSGVHDDLLRELVERVPHCYRAVQYAKTVKNRAIERQLLAKLRDAQQVIYDPNLSIAEKIEFTEGLTAGFHVQPEEAFKFLPAKEFVTSKYTTTPLIDGVLMEGEFCMMIGPTKCLKTSLAMAMGISLAMGAPLFGLFPVPERKRVGFMSGESGAGTLQSCFIRICRSMGISPESFETFMPCYRVPCLDIDSEVATVERQIRKHGFQVLFLDCLYLMVGETAGKASNLMSMGTLFRKLIDLQSRTGCTIIVLHHTPKHYPVGKVPTIDDGAFAGGGESMRQYILLNRIQKWNCENPGNHRVHFVAGGSAGHSTALALEIDEGRIDDEGGRYWKMTTEPVELRKSRDHGREMNQQRQKEQKLAKIEQDRQAVLAVMEKMSGPDTKTAINRQVKLSVPRFQLAWNSLVDGNLIATTSVNKGNNASYRAFILADRSGEWSTGQNPSEVVVRTDADEFSSSSCQPPPLKGGLA